MCVMIQPLKIGILSAIVLLAGCGPSQIEQALTQQNQALTAKVDRLGKKLQRSETNALGIQEAFEQSQGDLHATQTQLAQSQTVLEQTEAVLQETQTAMQAAQVAQQQAQTNAQTIQAEVAQEKSDLAKQRAENEKKMQQVAKQLSSLRKDNAQTRKTVQHTREQLAAVTQVRDVFEKKLEFSRVTRNTALGDKHAANKQLTQKTKQLQDVQKLQTHTNKMLTQHKKSLITVQRAHKTVHAHIAAKEKTIKTLQKTGIDAKAQNEELQSALLASRNKRVTLGSQMAALRNQIVSDKKAIDVLQQAKTHWLSNQQKTVKPPTEVANKEILTSLSVLLSEFKKSNKNIHNNKVKKITVQLRNDLAQCQNNLGGVALTLEGMQEKVGQFNGLLKRLQHEQVASSKQFKRNKTDFEKTVTQLQQAKKVMKSQQQVQQTAMQRMQAEKKRRVQTLAKTATQLKQSHAHLQTLKAQVEKVAVTHTARMKVIQAETRQIVQERDQLNSRLNTTQQAQEKFRKMFQTAQQHAETSLAEQRKAVNIHQTLQQEHTQLQAQYDKAAKSLQTLQTSHDQVAQAHQALEMEQAHRQEALTQAQATLQQNSAQAEQAGTQAKQEVARLGDALTDAQMQLQTQTQARDGLQAQLTQSQADSEQTQQTLTHVVAEQEKMVAEQEKMQQTLQQAQQQLNAATQQNEQVEQQTQALQARLQTLDNAFAQKLTQVDTLQTDLSVTHAQIAANETEQQQRAEKMQVALAEKNAELAAFMQEKRQNAALGEENQTLRERISQAQSVIATLNKDSAALTQSQAQVQTLQQSLMQAQAQQQTLQQAAQQAGVQQQQLREQMMRSSKRLEALQQQVRASNVQVSQVQQQRDVLQQEVAQGQEQSETLRSEMQQVKMSKEVLLSQLTDLQQQVQSLRQKDKIVTYTVKRGDTLSNIATRHYKNIYRWHDILNANKAAIDNPNAIEPGTVLVLP